MEEVSPPQVTGGGIRLNNELYHHGILGQKWGIRRYRNPDGTLTEEGRKRYGRPDAQKKFAQDVKKDFFGNKRKNSPQIKTAVNDLKNLAVERRNAREKYETNSRELVNYFTHNKDRLNEIAELAYDDAIKDDPDYPLSKKSFVDLYPKVFSRVYDPPFTSDEDAIRKYGLRETALRHFADSLNDGMIMRYKDSKQTYERISDKIRKASERYAEEFLGTYGNDSVFNDDNSLRVKDIVSFEIMNSINKIALDSSKHK